MNAKTQSVPCIRASDIFDLKVYSSLNRYPVEQSLQLSAVLPWKSANGFPQPCAMERARFPKSVDLLSSLRARQYSGSSLNKLPASCRPAIVIPAVLARRPMLKSSKASNQFYKTHLKSASCDDVIIGFTTLLPLPLQQGRHCKQSKV